MPPKYNGLYDGNLLENEIETMASWKNCEVPPHPDWISTRSVESTGEYFDFIRPNDDLAQDDGPSSDELITNQAEVAEDEMLELDDDVEEKEEFLSLNLPASAQWMASLQGKYRPYGKVKGQSEWEYFKDNVSKFHGRGDEADNYCSIRFSTFAESWNEWVDSIHTKNSCLSQRFIQGYV